MHTLKIARFSELLILAIWLSLFLIFSSIHRKAQSVSNILLLLKEVHLSMIYVPFMGLFVDLYINVLNHLENPKKLWCY